MALTERQYVALWRCLMIAAVLVVLLVLVMTGAL
jgi:hypothetical protein